MLQEVFCVVLFVWYEVTLNICCPSGTLIKRGYVISLSMPINEFCKVNTVYKVKLSSKVLLGAFLWLFKEVTQVYKREKCGVPSLGYRQYG
jgi:hypothetical protein